METVRSADGTTIAFERFGDGPSLVIVGGAFSDRSAAHTLAEVLARDFAVYTYDRMGRGDSGDTPPYAVEREIEDLGALIGEGAFVFGHSSGAVLSLEAAVDGLPISKLVVYEPPYIVDDTRVRPERLGERVSALIASGDRTAAMKLFFVEGPQMPPGAIEAMAGGPAWAPMEAMAQSLTYDLAITGDQVMPRDRLATIAVPTLALSGGDSPEWARNAVDAVAATIPGAKHVSLAGQTHGAADEVLAPVLVEFFRS